MRVANLDKAQPLYLLILKQKLPCKHSSVVPTFESSSPHNQRLEVGWDTALCLDEPLHLPNCHLLTCYLHTFRAASFQEICCNTVLFFKQLELQQFQSTALCLGRILQPFGHQEDTLVQCTYFHYFLCESRKKCGQKDAHCETKSSAFMLNPPQLVSLPLPATV